MTARFVGAEHTLALRYSRRERLRYWLTGRWPESVVDRRLAAWDADSRALEAARKSRTPA